MGMSNRRHILHLDNRLIWNLTPLDFVSLSMVSKHLLSCMEQRTRIEQGDFHFQY